MRLRSMLCFAVVCLFAAIGSAQSKSDVVVVQGINTVTFSATPTFDANKANMFKLTLAGNVTSSTLAHADPGQPLQFIICQDATGGRTFTPPTNVLSFGTISSTANACSIQMFLFDGSNALATGPMVSNNIVDGNLSVAGAVTAGGSPAGLSTGDMSASRTSGTGAVFLGTDGNFALFRSASGAYSFHNCSGTCFELAIPFGTNDQLVGRATTDTLTNKTLPSPTSTGTDSGTETLTNKSLGGSGSTTPTTPFNRLKANRGTTLTSSDFVISAAGTGFGSWGSTASIASVGTGATDAAGVINVSCSGTGQTGNPAVKLTFHDGAWPTAPTPIIMRGDGNSPAVPVAWFSVSTTSVTFALTGTCVAGNLYTLTWLMM